ncbi:hypothetical protein [Saezia sanguinis]|uniref:hypothetical protein n=1 Tax=Saezia sanguinis TaxID=1965230 RepID=UPI0030546ECC
MSLSKFAHLLGISAKASEDEEDKKVKKTEEEKEDEKDEEAEEEEEPKSKKSKKAEDEQDDTSVEEDDTSDDEDDEKESPDAKKARVAENKRCAAIFASPHAARNVGLAAHLAFETRVSAAEAIKMMQLSAGGTSSKTLLDRRMQSLDAPRLGQDAQHKHASTADQMKAIYNRVKGKK